MAQQPNIEIDSADRPRPDVTYAAPRHSGMNRPGVILTPADVPRGPAYGTPGPDTGFALRIVKRGDVPGRTPEVEKVAAALMGARAAHFGRAPTYEDFEVALLMLGLGQVRTPDLDARRARWVEAVAHEVRPGLTAVAQVGEVLFEQPAHVSAILKR